MTYSAPIRQIIHLQIVTVLIVTGALLLVWSLLCLPTDRWLFCFPRNHAEEPEDGISDASPGGPSGLFLKLLRVALTSGEFITNFFANQFDEDMATTSTDFKVSVFIGLVDFFSDIVFIRELNDIREAEGNSEVTAYFALTILCAIMGASCLIIKAALATVPQLAAAMDRSKHTLIPTEDEIRSALTLHKYAVVLREDNSLSRDGVNEVILQRQTPEDVVAEQDEWEMQLVLAVVYKLLRKTSIMISVLRLIFEDMMAIAVTTAFMLRFDYSVWLGGVSVISLAQSGVSRHEEIY